MEGVDQAVNGDKTNNSGTSSPVFIRKTSRNHNSISSPASLCSALTLNPPDSPEFFTCQSCGILDGELRTLDSQWRVVLVCKRCYDRIRSAVVCSYCFNPRDVDALVCRSCFCGVHLRCVHVQRGYISLSEFDPVSFTCIDCCAIQRPRIRKIRRSRVLLECLARNASSAAKKKVALADRARLNALKKADDARVAMEQAFDAIISARDAAVADIDLTTQIHLDTSGLSKILPRNCQTNLKSFLPVKKHCGSGRKTGNCRGRTKQYLGICNNATAAFESNKTSLSEVKCNDKRPKSSLTTELFEVDVRYASRSIEANLAKKGQNYDEALNFDEATKNVGLTLISCRESADSNSLVEVSDSGTDGREESPEDCTVPGRCVKML